MLFQHIYQGEGSRPVGRTPLHLQTKSPVFTKILARRYISSPFHFNRPVTTDFWKQRKLVDCETCWLRVLSPCLRLPPINRVRNCEIDCSNVRLHASIGIRSAGLVSSANHSIQSPWEPLRAASIGKEKAFTQAVSVRRSSRETGQRYAFAAGGHP